MHETEGKRFEQHTKMSTDKAERKKSKDEVKKDHGKVKRGKKQDGNKVDKQLKTAEAAFSLLADEKAANPALAALFAAKVRYEDLSMSFDVTDGSIATSSKASPSADSCATAKY